MRFGLALWCAGLLAAQTQPAPQDKCRVEGMVLNSVTGQPIPRAAVRLWNSSGPTSTPGAGATGASDADGKFVLTGVPPGAYQVLAERDNFQYIPPRHVEPLTLNAGDQKRDVAIRLTPLGAIAGHVVNEEGDPLLNAIVSVMVYEYTPAGRQLAGRNSAQTNDLGEYRIFGIQAGKYFLRAEGYPAPSPAAGGDVYPPTYYPGAIDPSAAGPIDLPAGQDMRGIDFTLRRMHGASVRGRVLKLAGSAGPFRGAVTAAGTGGATSVSSSYDANGGFQLRGLPPGAYTLTARDAVGDKTYIAQRSIEVGADGIEGIELSLLPPMEVSGVIRIEGDTAIKPSQARVSLQAQRQGGQSAVAEDGSFAIRNLGPDVYRVNVLAPAGLFVRSVRCGTADITDSGLDLTSGSGCDLAIALSANGGQIEGQVQDGDGKLAHRGAIVMLVPEGTRRDDLFRGTSVDANAHFKLAGIAPGSYRLYAWEEVDTNAVRYDPDFVKPFETSSQRVQISEGAIQTVTLKQIPKPEEQ